MVVEEILSLREHVQAFDLVFRKNTTFLSDVILYYTQGEFASSPILYTSCSGAHWEGKLSFTENASS